jgi:thiol-disulfide isomerase/thioredoxin
MRRLVLLSLLVLPTADAAPPAVKLDAVRYDDLSAEIRGLRGQVVLVDVWGTFCPPCKEKFPGIVALHEKYARRGLTVMSVSVDQPHDPTSKAAALAFLTKQRATFRNVILTDAAGVWQEKWKTVGPPLVFLFDRDGKLAGRWLGKFELAEVEKRVAEVIAEDK